MLVTQRDREIRRKMRVLDYAASVESASQACRYFGVGRATFYRWKEVLAKEGDVGLARKKPVELRLCIFLLFHSPNSASKQG